MSHRAQWEYTAAAQTAAAGSTLVLYPLDLIKVRLMTMDGTAARHRNGVAPHMSSSSSLTAGSHGAVADVVGGTASWHRRRWFILSSCRSIIQIEGARGLFRGAGLSVASSTASWGIYTSLLQLQPAAKEGTSSTAQSFRVPDRAWRSPSAFAGWFAPLYVWSTLSWTTTAFMTTPLWLLKTRMQLEDGSQQGLRNHVRRAIAEANGNAFRALWRGFPAQLALCFPSALNVPIYMTTLAWLCRRSNASSDPSSQSRKEANGDSRAPPLAWQITASSAAAKFCVLLVSHPIMVLKVRIQDPTSSTGIVQYNNMRGALRTTLAREGVFGLYKGFAVGLAQSAPRNVLYFQLFEASLRLVSAFRSAPPERGGVAEKGNPPAPATVPD